MSYVSISRAAQDVRIYTDSAAELAGTLARENSKTMALEWGEGEFNAGIRDRRN
jgi:hypothetical protein